MTKRSAKKRIAGESRSDSSIDKNPKIQQQKMMTQERNMSCILKAMRGAIREDSGEYTPAITRLTMKSTSIRARRCVQRLQLLGHEQTWQDNRKRRLKRNRERRRSYVENCHTAGGRKVERKMIYWGRRVPQVCWGEAWRKGTVWGPSASREEGQTFICHCTALGREGGMEYKGKRWEKCYSNYLKIYV